MARGFEHGPLNFKLMSPAIKSLVVANVGVFLFSLMVRGGEFYSIFALIPAKVVSQFWLWQLATYLFLHGGFLHLLLNLFALWMFGMAIESQWGPKEFLKYYFLCGIGAGIFSVLITPGSVDPIIGASGAIYGLLVAFAMLYPDAVVYLYFFFPIKAKHMALLFGAFEFFAGTAQSNPMVSRFTHLGGMIIGYVYLRWWWVWKQKTRELAGAWLTLPQQAKPKLKRARPKAQTPIAAPIDEMAEVDRILDKISASGEQSLTTQEREILRRQSERKKPNGSV